MFDRGELAQLARALALQARGQGFDSLILHEVGVSVSVCVGVYKPHHADSQQTT